MNLSIEDLSGQLVQAVSLILNSCTPNNQRSVAQKMLDEFKDTSPMCAECGFFLASQRNSSEVRYFGLQLIEHYIKLHWNEISCDEKNNIKNKVLVILSNDLTLKDNNHVKVGLARIVVEIIKREWPQQWPTLLNELHSLCLMGDVQTEVILLIFLRLAEDTVQFQNIPDKRRKEVFHSLRLHLKDLFPFFIQTLSSHYIKYCEHRNSFAHEDSVYHCRIVQVTLETLSVYLEWITINYISEDTYLLKQLCHLLDDKILQTSAAKCLLSLVDRKGKPDDRIPVLKLFEYNDLFKVRSPSFQPTEHSIEFEKTVCRVLVNLGTSLSYLMGLFKDVEEPRCFRLYLNCILSLTGHPSIVISQHTQSLWATILRNVKLSQSPAVKAIIPNLLRYEAEKLFNIGYKSKPNTSASKYSELEFDSDEDFETAYFKFRSEVMDVIKLISKLNPELAFHSASTTLKCLLNGEPCPLLSELEDTSCLNTYSIWDSVIHFLDSVCSPLMKNVHSAEVEKLSVEGIELLKMTLAFNCEDLYLTSYVLSCTSALFFFANFSTDLIVPLIKKIYSNLANQPASDEKNALPKEVLNLRRHSCSLLIKLAASQPKLLFTAFDQLCQCVKELLERPDQLSALEKSALLETLMILNNEVNDYDKQATFLNDMLSPILSAWLTDDMNLILSYPSNFISFVGLNVSPDESDLTTRNRGQLLFYVSVIRTCAKRCKIVTDHEIAESGKFIHPVSQNLKSVLYRNPAAPFLISFLKGIFFLARTINALYDPAVQREIHHEFTGVTEISESDKNSILGIPFNNENPQPRSNFDRMKNFLQGIHDGCLHSLGDSAENLSIDFYMMPNLSNYIKECLFYCLHCLPDYKLRAFIPFLKPFFYRCPVSVCDDLVNILTEFCNFMFEKLSSSWLKFKQKYGTSIGYEDQMTETEEILEDQLNRLVTREYITFLEALLQGKPMVDSTDTQMDDDSEVQQTSNSGSSKQLSELGLKIFQTEAVRGAIVCSVFDGLHWLDTVTNVHCLNVCKLVFKQLLQDGIIKQVNEASYLLQNALYGLQELGEHDSNQGLLLSFCTHVYEGLRPMFPELRDTLMSCVDCDLQTLDKMESILFKSGTKPLSEKQKKEAFRNAVQKIIGKNIGQYHKRDIVIKNLPALFIIPKTKKCDLLTEVNEEIGLCKLFNSS